MDTNRVRCPTRNSPRKKTRHLPQPKQFESSQKPSALHRHLSTRPNKTVRQDLVGANVCKIKSDRTDGYRCTQAANGILARNKRGTKPEQRKQGKPRKKRKRRGEHHRPVFIIIPRLAPPGPKPSQPKPPPPRPPRKTKTKKHKTNGQLIYDS